jgi:hypothetical protein
MERPMQLRRRQDEGMGRHKPLNYFVAFRLSSGSQLYLLALTALVLAAPDLSAATLFVSLNSTSPAPPYTNWQTAATIIQDAVDAALPGDTVLVTNGVYTFGGRAAGTNQLINRVAVTNRVWVSSVNGPQFTSIRGRQLPGVTNGPGAIRCVYLADGAGLSGFTLARGATLTNDFSGPFIPSYLDLSGGAVCCDSTNAFITNCVLTSCAAFFNGGGANSGTLSDCAISNNWTPYFGGGAYLSTLTRCTLRNNWADSGGGVKLGVLSDCLLVGNIAGGMDGFGGGARDSILNNCTLTGNSAWIGGGATGYGNPADCVLNNCIIYSNTAQFSGPDASQCTLYYCRTTDPLFVDYANGNFRLLSNSPCINAGNNNYVTSATDLDGKPRVVNGTVDIGAYEYPDSGSVIPTDWLQAYGLPTDGSADYTDPDNDGMNNWQEWVCGTSPIDAQSALRMVSAVPVGANVVVTWQSVGGVRYTLERSMLLTSQFTVLATNIIGQGVTTTFTDTNAASLTLVFYRVGVKPP